MAKFILGNRLRHSANESRVMSASLWLIDLLVLSPVLGLFAILPASRASALGAQLGRWIGRRLRRTRHVRANLSLALPDKTPEEIDRLASDVWANAGRVLAEYPKLRQIVDPRRDHMRIEIMAPIPTYGDPTQPAVFVTAHQGNWELLGAALTRLGIPTLGMYAPLSNPWLDRLLLRYRGALGCRLVSRSAGLRPFLDALKRGESAGMIVDRRIEGGKPILFFGEHKDSSMLAARLALRFQVPLVPVEIERRPKARFVLRFHPPLRPSDHEADIDAQANDLTRQLHALFEQWIRARPGEWLCTSKIWPTAVLSARTDVYKSG